MIRTLTWVSCLALLAGLAVGFFVSECRASGASSVAAAPVDPKIEEKVRAYVEHYDLSPSKAAEIRTIFLDYDRSVLDLLRRLRAQHPDDFRALFNKANERIEHVISPKSR